MKVVLSIEPCFPLSAEIFPSEAQSCQQNSSLYSCGHLYHSLCLLSKECGTVTKGLMRWMCYKCNSSTKGGKLSENFSALKKGSGASLAQVRVVRAFLFE